MGEQIKNMSWYPGHMKKALDEIKKSLHIVDAVLEIGDARAPYSSLNEALDRTIGDKRKIIIFSKKDLSDEEKVKKYLAVYASKGIEALALDFKDKKDIAFLLKYLSSVKSTKALRYERYGLAVPPLRCLIVGIPNVGKSTLINSLVGKKKTSVANKPGQTKTQQLVKLGDRLEMFDTPGILQPNYEDKSSIMRLAWIGSVADDALPIEEVYASLASFVLKEYRQSLYSHYSIPSTTELNEGNIFFEIGKERKFLLPGNEIDIARAKTTFLKEFRAGEIERCVVDNV